MVAELVVKKLQEALRSRKRSHRAAHLMQTPIIRRQRAGRRRPQTIVSVAFALLCNVSRVGLLGEVMRRCNAYTAFVTSRRESMRARRPTRRGRCRSTWSADQPPFRLRVTSPCDTASPSGASEPTTGAGPATEQEDQDIVVRWGRGEQLARLPGRRPTRRTPRRTHPGASKASPASVGPSSSPAVQQADTASGCDQR